MNDQGFAAYVEGDYLGDGWHYRINRMSRVDGTVAYAVVLTHENPSSRGNRLYIWLSEYATPGEARAVAREAFLGWRDTGDYGLSA